MLKISVLSFCLSTIFLSTKFFFLWILSKGLRKRFDFIEISIEFVFIYLVSLSFLLGFSHISYKVSKVASICIGIILGSAIISYNFIFYPFLVLIRVSKYKITNKYETWFKSQYPVKLSIRILEDDSVNAYALGIFNFSKIIFITKGLVEKMHEDDIKNLIYHELGHLKGNHLLGLYLSNVFCCALSIISASFFYPKISQLDNPGLFIFFHGAVFGLLYIIIPGLIQRSMEFKADRYAVLMVGAVSYSETLKRLNDATDKGLEKVTLNYPDMKSRLKNVVGI